MTETFHGYIDTTQDVLLIFEGCRRGLLSTVTRRLKEKERHMIRSGSVFVFDEKESGIKRWTDGLLWSPSRILGNFLIYRELDKKQSNDKKIAPSSNDSRQRSFSADQTSGITDRNRERRLVGSLLDSYHFRKDGLIKKTMSVILNGSTQHLVSYYHPQDIIANKLRTPSSIPELTSLEISPELLAKQNFRVPPSVEPSFENSEGLFLNQQHQQQFDDRRANSYRSMSMGSLHNNGNIMIGNTSSLMYTPSHTNPTGNSIDGYRKLSNQSNNYYGFSPLPSPSSITSSPMLSPVNPTFPRHYSSSSSSSGPMQRFATRNSFDLMSNEQSQATNPRHSIHPQLDAVFLPPNEQTMKEKTGHEPVIGLPNMVSPHIGQLLNPIHPLKQEEHLLQMMDSTKYTHYLPPPPPPQTTHQHQQGLDNYYYERQNSQDLVPMFRNGLVLPNSTTNTTTSNYDENIV